jgi:uncharacterized membrane protein
MVFTLLLFWCMGILYPFLFTHLNNAFFEFIFTNLYSTVCHQQSEKCISIGSQQILVCSRCAGVYFGALISALAFFPLMQIEKENNILLIALLILCTDVLFVSIGIYDYSKSISFITGLMFGGAVYLYLINELEHFLFTSKNKISK